MQSSGFGLKVLIGFAATLFALVGAYITFDILTPTEYEDFEHITSYQEILDQEEEQYVVYWYGPTCSHCALIKDQVIRFARRNNEGLKVYFVNSSSTTGVANLEHPTNPNIAMTGTPTMIIVKDGQVADMVVGSEDIPNLIDLINDGNYDVID